MRILITGANGFVGSHITEQLISDKHEITALIRKSSNIKYIKDCNINYEYVSLDDEEKLTKLLAKFDVVLHCAGVVRALNWEGYEKTNIIGTRNIVNAAIKNKSTLKKFIYISSQAAMGPSTTETPKLLTEKESPVSFYGKSKLLAEQEVKKLEGNVPYTILRPASVYGPRDKDIFIFFNLVKHHLKPQTYAKRFIQLVFVKDIAGVISKILENENTNNKTYYLSDGSIYTWKSVAETIAKANNIKTIPVMLFDFIFKTTAALYEVVAKFTKKPQVLSREKIVEMLQTYWTADSSAITKDTGFEFKKLEIGAKITYNWYVENKYF
ncbi:MAG: NAD(P)-dependent oxidoreductase [Elusimicrobia bacterium]|nr:NAD(P)-dependent oxidoreductase [Elusimicrobiota bacterium]